MSRTLVVTNDFPPRRGGIETFVRSLCHSLPADQVVVYTRSMPGDAAYDAGLRFPVVRDPDRLLLPTATLGDRVAGVLGRFDCDRVLFGAAAPLALLAPRLRRAGASRVVALTHGHEVGWTRVLGVRRLMRRIGRDCDTLTYVSQWCRDQIARPLRAEDAARMVRLAPGVDTDRFYPGCGGAEVRARLGISPRVPVVVCTARMVARKGQDALIRAWPEVLGQVPEAVLLLVGDGPDRRRVQRLARRLGVAGQVVFSGSVPWREVPSYTDAGDVFAMPCRTRWWGLEPEALGIVLLEAAACGLPVVAGASGGAPETVVDGETGLVVDGRDNRRLARGLVALLTDASRTGEMGRAGRRWVEREWAWPRVDASGVL